MFSAECQKWRKVKEKAGLTPLPVLGQRWTHIADSEAAIHPVCVLLLAQHLHCDIPISNRIFCKRPVMVTFHLKQREIQACLCLHKDRHTERSTDKRTQNLRFSHAYTTVHVLLQ